MNNGKKCYNWEIRAFILSFNFPRGEAQGRELSFNLTKSASIFGLGFDCFR